MNDKIFGSNSVTIAGKIATPLNFSHELCGEKFYKFMLDVNRLSDTFDSIPITISERLLTNSQLDVGNFIKIIGQFRSYNHISEENTKLILTVFAREFELLSPTTKIHNPNQIYLDGYLCKPVIYRVTPLGREISDLIIAINRQYGKSDYIPCITWGRNARYCEQLKVGNRLKIWGRIQSRNYQKKLNENDTISKVAYEVSVTKLEIIPNSKHNNT